MTTVGLIGTLDTTREEYVWLRDEAFKSITL
jgi:hypothetical protein